MERDELRALLSHEGSACSTRSADRRHRPTSCASSRDCVPRATPRRSRRRRADQARLRAKARAKFGDFAARMLFTPDGLEQATRLRRRRAARRPLRGCRDRRRRRPRLRHRRRRAGHRRPRPRRARRGARRGDGRDRDASTSRRSPASASSSATPTTTDLTGVGGVWLDPARRDAGGRRLDTPPTGRPALDWAFALAEPVPTGIKLGPGIDRDLIPADAEAQWVSVDREVVELGALVRARSRARGSAGRPWCCATTGRPSSPQPRTARTPRWARWASYLLEPDGAVIRARLIGDLAALARRSDDRRHDRVDHDGYAARDAVRRRRSACSSGSRSTPRC